MATAEGDDGVGAGDGPEHAGLFEAAADDGFAAGFDHARADEQVLATELGIAHALGVVLKVSGFDSDAVRNHRRGGIESSKEPNQLFDFPAVEFGLVAKHPLLLTQDVAGVQKSSHVPEVLPGMKQIDDLNSAGKVLICIVPDPFGSVSDDDLLLGSIPAAIPGLQVNSVAKPLAVSMAPV
jgi:hypothetical protein